MIPALYGHQEIARLWYPLLLQSARQTHSVHPAPFDSGSKVLSVNQDIAHPVQERNSSLTARKSCLSILVMIFELYQNPKHGHVLRDKSSSTSVSCSAWTIEYSFDTLCRLLARAALSLSELYVFILARGVVRGRVMVEEAADEETDETTTDMSVQ
jgi:hypothetical protein